MDEVISPFADKNSTSSMTSPAEMETVPINNESHNISNPMITNTNLHNRLDNDNTERLIEVTVTEPQKIGEGMSAYLAYRLALPL